MTREEKAVEQFLRSVDECRGMRPAPALRPDDEITCQGFARNRALEAANGR